MAETVYIGDDREMKVLFCEQDFINLVWERLGRDAGIILEEIIEARDELARENEELSTEERYEVGWSDGHSAGYQEGYYDGYETAREDLGANG